MRSTRYLWILLAGLWGLLRSLTASPEDGLDRYNVVWTSPSTNAAGSMPIGNGEVGLNVWVEAGGDLVFYISRTDAWSEACRLLKLGRVRLSLSPNPFAAGVPFRQELKLRDGCIEVTAGPTGQAARLKVFVDANAPVVHLIGSCDRPYTVQVASESWRTEKKVLTGEELRSSWTMQDAPPNIEVWESADVVRETQSEGVVWYHRNESSVVPLTLKQQSLDRFAELLKDPLLHRTFGGFMTAPGFEKENAATLKSAAPLKSFAIRIAAHASQTESPAAWEEELRDVSAQSADARLAAERTANWWAEFWERSWIFVEGDQSEPSRFARDTGSAPLSQVTRAYILQRWMAACGGRGHYPIKFNGAIFTVEPEFAGGPKFNADWRRWGDCYWWQNTRFPYFAMLPCGDFEHVKPVFRMYRDVLPLCQARARFYYGAEGAYFPETMTPFGTYANRDYGWERQGHTAGEVLSPWWRYAWQQGLELALLMLDYYDYTDDARFFTDELIPMADPVLRYYATRFGRDATGRWVISPTQSVETYWYGVTNDTPSVAGLNAVLDRLLVLPKQQAPTVERRFWLRLKAMTPAVPVRVEAGKNFILPAEQFSPQRSNIENPELYAVWPFALFGVGRPDRQTGIETWSRRVQKTTYGWSYDGQCAARLGLADEAKQQILEKIRNSHPNYRFPAMWGPNYDWLPDQTHGSNLMLTLQNMLLVPVGDKIQLLPAWPKNWNVRFKLHAPHRTTVECEYRDGKMTRLKVEPEARRADVIAPGV